MANIHYRTQKASDSMDKPLTGETDQTTSQTTDNANRPNVTDTRGKSAHRIALLRAYMREHNLDGLLIRTTSNIMWLSAFDDVFDENRHIAFFLRKMALCCTPILATTTRASLLLKKAKHR